MDWNNDGKMDLIAGDAKGEQEAGPLITLGIPAGGAGVRPAILRATQRV